MAVYTYGLAASDVIAVLPMLDGEAVSSSSGLVSTTDIVQFIEDGAAQLNSAVLDRSSITPDENLDEDTHAALRAAVRVYAVAKVADLLGMQTTYERAWNAWQGVYGQYLSAPRTLGAAYTDGYTVDVDFARNLDRLDPPQVDDYDFIGPDKKW